VPREVRPAARVDDVDERGRLAEVIEKLVPEAAPLVRTGDQARDVEDVDGHEPLAVLATPMDGPTGFADLRVRAPGADVRDAAVRLDRRERIGRGLRGGGGRGGGACPLPHVRLADDPELHETSEGGPASSNLAGATKRLDRGHDSKSKILRSRCAPTAPQAEKD